jgi:hypothetical protein
MDLSSRRAHITYDTLVSNPYLYISVCKIRHDKLSSRSTQNPQFKINTR